MTESRLDIVRAGCHNRAQAHGQILSFRGDKITEIVFFPTAEAALGAAGAV